MESDHAGAPQPPQKTQNPQIFIETFASLKLQNISLFFFKATGKEKNYHTLNLFLPSQL
jgi:hypothetical protein